MSTIRWGKRTGFTLLELLVVVAILAIIAGGLIVAYEGLEEKSAQGTATYNLGALNSAIRHFAATNNGKYPTEWDSLLYSSAGDGSDSTALNLLPSSIRGKLAAHTLTGAEHAALQEAGITTVRFVGSGYDNGTLAIDGGTATGWTIPNRVFDDSPRGRGVVVPLSAGTIVARIETLGDTDFGGGSADPNRLNDIAGLDPTVAHQVVAFGIGNNSTLVHSTGSTIDSRTAGLAEAPYYQNVRPVEYGRFVALFHLGSNGTTFSKARFLTVIDTKGDWYDEEIAEYQGVKP